MKACAFFGHGKEDYESYKEYIEEIIVDLIEEKGITQFYSGGRGAFDIICAKIVGRLKKEYPQIKNTLVLSYIPQEKDTFILNDYYDDSVYLLEKKTLPKFAIAKTNEAMVDKADIIMTAVRNGWGGAYNAYQYAQRRQKEILNIYDVIKEQDILERRFHDLIESQGTDEKEGVWKRIVERMKKEEEK